MIKLHWALQRQVNSMLRESAVCALISNAASKVSMAVANRDKYNEVANRSSQLIELFKTRQLLGKPEETNKENLDGIAKLARFWEQHYGMTLKEANRQGA